MATYEDMLAVAESIRTATHKNENTAERVGGLLVDMVETLQSVFPRVNYNDIDTITETGVYYVTRSIIGLTEDRIENGILLVDYVHKKSPISHTIWQTLILGRSYQKRSQANGGDWGEWEDVIAI